MKSTKWLKIFFLVLVVLLMLESILIFIVDPFLHYHAPLKGMSYFLQDERYQNNGILKNYSYNAIITGTSHNEQFNASEFDKLFGVNSVKVPLYGAQFKEIADQMKLAIKYNENLKYVLYGITYGDILSDKDSVGYVDIPTYLYDDNLINDYQYLFNISALKMVIKNFLVTIKGEQTTNFDDYAKWETRTTFSKEQVLDNYKRQDEKNLIMKLTDYETLRVKENIKQNITSIIGSNKDITFYIFLTPHSIAWWDKATRGGTIVKYLEAEEILIDELLKYDNVKLYSFFTNYELICDLNNYTDVVHYSENVNSKILNWIKNDEYEITNDNKEEYIQEERKFYLKYDYDSIFE